MTQQPPEHGVAGAISQLFLGVVLGGACFAAAHTMMSVGVGEGIGWTTWIAAMCIAGVAMGYMTRPTVAFASAVLIVAIQPVGVYLTNLASGEIAQPTRSTGGMAGVCIMSALLVMASPVVLLGAWAGGVLARRRIATGATLHDPLTRLLPTLPAERRHDLDLGGTSEVGRVERGDGRVRLTIYFVDGRGEWRKMIEFRGVREWRELSIDRARLTGADAYETLVEISDDEATGAKWFGIMLDDGFYAECLCADVSVQDVETRDPPGE